MEVEVMIPSPPSEFNFDSASTSPYISAPSSPQRLAAAASSFFYSAPASPTRISAFYDELHGSSRRHTASLSAVPFNWEEKPGISKAHLSSSASSTYGDAEEELEQPDFEFDFSGQLDQGSLPADELFDGGKIKPLKPPPRFQYDHNSKPLDSPKSPKSPKKMIRDALSPRNRAKDIDPFAAAMEQTRRQGVREEKRGRERTNNASSSSGSRIKSSRSLSPLRVSDLLFDPETTSDDHHPNNQEQPAKQNSPFSSFWYKKWKIKDLLLFRSASESRAKEKEEQLKKYTMLKKARQDDVKNSSFRSTENVGSVSGRKKSSSGPPISAHELHYTMNRAFSEEMRKRTSLPYKQGLLGCLGFHPTVNHELSKGIISPSGSMSRGVRDHQIN